MDRERTEECLDPPAAQKGSHRPREGDKGGQLRALARSVTPRHCHKQTRVSVWVWKARGTTSAKQICSSLCSHFQESRRRLLRACYLFSTLTLPLFPVLRQKYITASEKNAFYKMPRTLPT